MIHLKSYMRNVRAFRSKEDGSATIELVFLVPLLAVITFGLFTFFQAFKAKTTAVRATSVVADMLSREQDAVTPEYLDGITSLLETVVDSDADPEYRVTAFIWSDTSDEYEVVWSESGTGRTAMSNEALNFDTATLPTLRNQERAFMVETWIEFEPAFGYGTLKDTTFANAIVSSPRFVPQLCYMDNTDDEVTTSRC